MNIEELNIDCPEHDRSSCSDVHPINAGVDYRYGTTWCRRCEGLHNIRADTRIAELEAAMAEARRDVARLDTLSAHLADDITICPPEKHGKGDGWLIFWQTGWDDHGQLGEETHGATLRDAIDAARANGGEG